MSNLQQSIAPMGAPAAAPEQPKKPTDPVTAEYEDGKRFLENGDTAQAALAFHNVLLAHEEAGDETGVANACNQLGNVCMARNEYEQARSHYKRAWEICDKLFDEMSLMALDRQFLAIHRALQEYDEAISLTLNLFDTYCQNRDPHGTVAALEQLADIYLEAGRPADAADTYRTVASIHKNYKHAKIAESFMEKAAELEAAAE